MNKYLLLLSVSVFLMGLVFVSCSNEQKLTANKELVKKFTELINNEEFDELKTIVREDLKRHSQATMGMPELNSLDEFVKLQKEFLSSFPDQKVTLEKLIAEGDQVAVYATYSGTQTGSMPPFPVTNKHAELKYLGILRIEENKIAEMWVEWDNIAFLTQLGLFPPSAE